MPLIGAFVGRTQSPVITARVVFRRLRLNGEIRFLVDTGADFTMISSTDASDLHIDLSRLAYGPVLSGIGGTVRTRSEPAAIVFRDAGRTVHVYRTHVVIASPQMMPRGLPSVLGRNILNRWHMTYRPTERRLEFEVVSADDSFDLDA